MSIDNATPEEWDQAIDMLGDQQPSRWKIIIKAMGYNQLSIFIRKWFILVDG